MAPLSTPMPGLPLVALPNAGGATGGEPAGTAGEANEGRSARRTPSSLTEAGIGGKGIPVGP